MLKEWHKSFFSQPHQPFFVYGFVQLIFCMLLLFLVYSNILNINFPIVIFHAYFFIFIIFIQFFVGFLFIVFPKFLMQAEVLEKTYTKQFYIYLFGTLIFVSSLVFSSKLYVLGALIVLSAQMLSLYTLYLIFKKSIIKDKYDTKWILISFSSGIIAHIFFLISLIDFKYNQIMQTFSTYAGFYLFLFMIFFTISQRMIPFFTSMKIQNYKINKSKNLLEIVYSLLFLKVIILSFNETKLYFIADIPLFLFFVYEIYKWKLPIFKTPAIIWVLYLALYWIPIGILFSLIESLFILFEQNFIFEKASLHIFGIGYFITALVGFGTRVVLGHSGRTIIASNFAIFIFIAIQFILVIRIIASFSPNIGLDYVFLINLSAILLILILLLWSLKYLGILIKIFKKNQ